MSAGPASKAVDPALAQYGRLCQGRQGRYRHGLALASALQRLRAWLAPRRLSSLALLALLLGMLSWLLR